MNKLSATEQLALINTALQLGINPDDLYALIDFESRWNPVAKNPDSSARGLIQFIDSTAKDLGYENSLDLVTKNPTIETQLKGPVYEYLKQWIPYTGKQSLYMAVFYPTARTWPPEKEFPEWVQNNNPGIDTVQSYMDKVKPFELTENKPSNLLLSGAVALVGLGLFFIYSFSKKGQ